MSKKPKSCVERLGAAIEDGNEDLLASLLDPAVRWGGEEETPETCHNREQVIVRYRQLRAAGVRASVEEVIAQGDTVVFALALRRPDSGPASEIPALVYQVFKLVDERVVDIRGFAERQDALGYLGGAS
jgi:hypothetical protein